MSSDERDPTGPDEPIEDDLDLDDVDVKDLLRQALAAPDEPPEKITSGVHKKIREQTQGRFFADGWSTSLAPLSTFLVTSLLMLLIVLVAFWLLSPVGIEVVP